MGFWTCFLRGRSQCSQIFPDTAPFLCLFPVLCSSVSAQSDMNPKAAKPFSLYRKVWLSSLPFGSISVPLPMPIVLNVS